jgi:hypothetical protein
MSSLLAVCRLLPTLFQVTPAMRGLFFSLASNPVWKNSYELTPKKGHSNWKGWFSENTGLIYIVSNNPFPTPVWRAPCTDENLSIRACLRGLLKAWWKA